MAHKLSQWHTKQKAGKIDIYRNRDNYVVRIVYDHGNVSETKFSILRHARNFANYVKKNYS